MSQIPSRTSTATVHLTSVQVSAVIVRGAEIVVETAVGAGVLVAAEDVVAVAADVTVEAVAVDATVAVAAEAGTKLLCR